MTQALSAQFQQVTYHYYFENGQVKLQWCSVAFILVSASDSQHKWSEILSRVQWRTKQDKTRPLAGTSNLHFFQCFDTTDRM